MPAAKLVSSISGLTPIRRKRNNNFSLGTLLFFGQKIFFFGAFLYFIIFFSGEISACRIIRNRDMSSHCGAQLDRSRSLRVSWIWLFFVLFIFLSLSVNQFFSCCLFFPFPSFIPPAFKDRLAKQKQQQPKPTLSPLSLRPGTPPSPSVQYSLQHAVCIYVYLTHSSGTVKRLDGQEMSL